MQVRTSPTVRARRLRQQLRRLRDAHGLTLEQVATASEGSFNASTVGRYETGDRIPRQGDLRILLDIYGVEGDERATLLALAREARQRGWWWPDRQSLKAGFDIYLGLESEASTVRTYQSQLLHGLLQTEEYARSVIKAITMTAPQQEVEQLVELRMARKQRLVQAEPLGLWAVLDEAVLTRRVGGSKVMGAQLRHLVDIGRQPNVTIQVLPAELGAHPAMEGPFYILQFPEPDDLDVVYLEQPTSSLAIESEAEVSRYTLTFGQLTAMALTPEKSMEFIASKADELQTP
ncbi:XRE family transcriptional regulator [Sphaerisporangium album]|uniref:XRE family transcriptional regulator n=1 Tax=Sphaerisporangium album TaxID=509200 RepID=A0A367FAJ8_9ACTN|nr:helix-turn-helix transcriptional regulator [Sphaerisporangium album]RCG27374.1 XRE family transcriptional regulator [Sphaerisporangium album]